ncbi:hypothetical protein L5515_008247 [Caenorhabditis briggsae]|uniref:Kinesin light chain n=1 Tax=Caenorhabditis briggsae TaxID=6238 RepID=A0AAE9F4G7_CAEBR|nr:hypothetical protein L5515_008247 [Caenorhabditis briggsae]
MTQDDVTTGLRTVQQGLEALREEHSAISNTLETNVKDVKEDEAPIPKQKLIQIDDNLDKLMCGVDETSMMLMVFQLTQGMDAQHQMYQAQRSRLCQENEWLLDELKSFQIKLQQSERMVAQLEEENKHLKYMASIKQFDDGAQADTKTVVNSGPQPVTSETLQELGFGPEDEEDLNTSQFAQPTPAPSMASAVVGYEIPARLRTIHNLVIQYASEGRYEVAVPLCKQSLEDLENTIGHAHPDVATMLNILALVYRDQNKYKEAANLLNEALSIRNDDPHVAKQLNNLALLCQNQGKYDETEKYYKRALEIYESKLGPNQPEVTKTKNNLSSAYLKQGKYKEAEDLYKQILNQAHEKEYGQVSRDNKTICQIVASALKKLGDLYRRQGKYEAAETLEDVALRAKKQVRYDENPRACQN